PVGPRGPDGGRVRGFPRPPPAPHAPADVGGRRHRPGPGPPWRCPFWLPRRPVAPRRRRPEASAADRTSARTHRSPPGRPGRPIHREGSGPWLTPKGCPPTWRETTPSNVGSAGINQASSVSCLITIWLGPRPRDCPKSFSTCLAFRAPVRIAFAGSSGRVLVGGGAAGSFARRHGRHGSGRRGGRLRVRGRAKRPRARRRV